MATKPTDAAPWATNTNYPADGGIAAGTQTKTAASPTLRARGFRPGRRIAGQILNEWMNNVGRWTEWLKDGVLGAIEVTNLLVTGNLTVQGDTYHGLRNIPIPGILAEPTRDPWATGSTSVTWRWKGVNADSARPAWNLPTDGVGRLLYPVLGIREGDRINAYGVHYKKSSSTGTTLNMRLLKATIAAGTVEELDTFGVTAIPVGNYSQMTHAPASPVIVETYTSYYIEVWSSDPAASDGNVDGFLDAYVNASHPAP